VDIFEKCSAHAERARMAREANVYPFFRMISSGQDPVVCHQGDELVMLGSNV